MKKIKDFNLNKTIEYLLYLIPLTPVIFFPFVFNPYSTSKYVFFGWLISLVGILFSILIFKDKKKIKIDLTTVLFSSFTLIIFVTSVLSYRPAISLLGNWERNGGFIFYLSIFIFLIILKNLFSNRDSKKIGLFWRRFFNIVILVASFISIYGILQFFGYLEINQTPNPDGVIRINSTIGNSALLSEYLILTVFLSLFVIFRRTHKKWVYTLYAISVALQVYALFLTSSRAGFLALVSGFSVLLMFFVYQKISLPNKTKFKILVSLFTAFVLLVSSLFIFSDNINSFLENKYGKSSPISRILNFDLKHTSINNRFILWGIGFEAFKEKPILGWGVENFNIPYDKYYDERLAERWYDKTHNVFVDWLVYTGIFGLINYILILSTVLYFLLKSKISLKEKVLLSTIIIAYLIHNTFLFETITGLVLFTSIIGYISSYSDNLNFKFIYISKSTVISFVILFLSLTSLFFISSRFLSHYYLDRSLDRTLENQQERLSYYKKTFNYEFAESSLITYYLLYAQRIILSNNNSLEDKNKYYFYSLDKIEELTPTIRYSPMESLNVAKYLHSVGLEDLSNNFFNFVQSEKVGKRK